jgi:hypothetical protein
MRRGDGHADGSDKVSAGRRRHPAEVTSERLLQAYERWYGRLDSGELIAIGTVREALWRIAAEDAGEIEPDKAAVQ